MAPTQTIQSNDGRIHIGDCAHVLSSPAGKLTPDLAKEWAKASDIISVNPGQLQGQEGVMKDLTDLGIYVKADHDTDAKQPEANYSHQLDKTGAVIRRFNKQWGVYIMQPDSPWREKHLADLKAMLKKYPWLEFFFVDSAGNYSYTATGDPIKTGSNKTYTQAEWLAMLKFNLDYWAEQVPLKHRVINGLQKETVDLYTPCIGMVEAAFGPLDGVPPTEADWNRLFDLVWQAQAKGWTPWLYVKMRDAFDGPKWQMFRSLSLPSAYLMDRGSLLYLIAGIEHAPPSWQTGEYKHPWYKPNIGQPLPVSAVWQEMRTPSGAYMKLYERGAVIVNPTQAGVRVDLPGGGDIAVGAYSGTIMRASTVTTWQPIA